MSTTQAPTTDAPAETKPEEPKVPETSVTRPKVELPAEMQQQIELARMKAAVAAAIKGTMWGKDLSPIAVRAVAEYARENNLDAVRHIEVLGGNIYLKADLYEERGAPFIQAGLIRKDEPDYINADERLDRLEKAGDEWAKTENVRRLRARIEYNVPEVAKAAVVTRLWVRGMIDPRTNEPIPVVGVNWCGGGSRQRDPVGDAEPTKTAASRSARRAWKQIVEAIPSYGVQLRGMVDTMSLANEMIQKHDEMLAVHSAPAAKSIPATSSAGYAVDLECRVPETAPVSVPTAEDPF